jgi:hypothetical protein
VLPARSAGLVSDASDPKTREASRFEQHRLLVAEPEVLQRAVHVGEGHGEGARSGAPVAILSCQRNRGGAISRDSSGKGHADDGAWRQPDALPERADRVEHCAGGARQRAAIEDDRSGGRAPAADEASAIGFPFDRTAQARPVHAQHVEADDRRFIGRTRPAAEQEAGALRIELGLDEQLPERRDARGRLRDEPGRSP